VYEACVAKAEGCAIRGAKEFISTYASVRHIAERVRVVGCGSGWIEKQIEGLLCEFEGEEEG
jgi:hypothetical protein